MVYWKIKVTVFLFLLVISSNMMRAVRVLGRKTIQTTIRESAQVTLGTVY